MNVPTRAKALGGLSFLVATGLLAGCPSTTDGVPETPDAACVGDCDAASPDAPSPPPSGTDASCAPNCPPPLDESALGTWVLGSPTASGVTLSLLPKTAVEVYLEAGTSPGQTSVKSEITRGPGGAPLVATIAGLPEDATIYYRVRLRPPGATDFSTSKERTFHTARKAGATFTFTVQADSHRDENSNLDIYRRALDNVRADAPDFHVDLGDTFMTEKFAKTEAEVVDRYIEERSYFGRTTDTVPLFLVNGNHEGEVGWVFDGATDNLAVWATKARLRYFVAPTLGGLYTGDDATNPLVGRRVGYYAFTWGDALFVALDPFWYTETKPRKGGEGWGFTLGDAQYRWLQRTLETSTAKYKVVFAHHLVGGLDDARGGVEGADLWEWGGKGASGADEFATRRPGWAKPIHRLLVDTKASAFFHGHDHLYCKQDKDGIVYQEVPQPSHPGGNAAVTAAAGGYVSGTILPSSGHLRVKVAPDKMTVEYVRAVLPTAETPTLKNGSVADSYTIVPR